MQGPCNPFLSQVLVSETSLGFWQATLSRPVGGIHGLTEHLNRAAGPSIWSLSTTWYTGLGRVMQK